MLDLDIPGFGNIKIQHIIFDFNGTLALDGIHIAGVAEALNDLATKFQLHVVTGDSRGTAKEQLASIKAEIVIMPNDNQAIAKANYIIQLDPDHVIAIGNGRNDQQMLQMAHVGIVVLGAEGMSVSALSSADIIAPDILAAIAIVQNEQRLMATLRS
jgi:P-type E1-E2 ATPase